MIEAPTLNAGARDTLRCLFFNGATWDGDIPSKAGRGDLIDAGLALRIEEWTYLTPRGVEVAVQTGFADDLRRRPTP